MSSSATAWYGYAPTLISHLLEMKVLLLSDTTSLSIYKPINFSPEHYKPSTLLVNNYIYINTLYHNTYSWTFAPGTAFHRKELER